MNRGAAPPKSISLAIIDERYAAGDAVRLNYEIQLPRQHDDFGMIEPVVNALLARSGGWQSFSLDVSRLIRRAIDEVIDTERTNRFILADTEKTEKTYLGTKIEILFRWALKLSKGRTLDLSVDGAEVDIKNTMGSNWAIPEEAVSKLCILIKENERNALCSVGVVVAHGKYLNPGANKDRKRTLSILGQQNVWWIFRNLPYPPNIWEALSLEERERINHARGGSERVAALFAALQDRPISRTTIQNVAQQKDALKRVRRNGGARDILSPRGIAILFGRSDRHVIAGLGLPPISVDEFISHSPIDELQRVLLRKSGHID